ncbi:MAG: hypothetical protein AAGF97_07585 [Planctomycetota bacterium]
MERRAQNPSTTVGWLSSLAIHLLIANLIVLLLVPPHFGQATPLVIEMSAAAAKADPQPIVQLVEAAEPALGWEPPLPEAKVSGSLPLPDLALAGQGGLGGDGRGAALAGPHANYFGISAAGDRFVYALDMSTSMNARMGRSAGGSRFKRACAELQRSVNALTADQSFYVILFCYKTRYLFDESQLFPQMVPATDENKARLREWLATIRTGPGTDPRSSVHVGLQMRPSALFLLSDGEFNGHSGKRRCRGLIGNPTIQDVVFSQPGAPVPIHAIAYEDQINRATMEQLAALTGGEFRFVSSGRKPTNVVQRRATFLLQSVQRLEDQGNLTVAKEGYEHIMAEYAGTDAADIAASRILSLKSR